METRIIALTVLVLLSAFVAEPMGAKRRIGSGWAFYFMLFGGFLLGWIIVNFSPPLSNLPSYSNKWKTLNSTLAIVAAIITIGLVVGTIRLFFIDSHISGSDFGEEYAAIYLSLFSGGISYYMFNRDKRNKVLFEKINTQKKDSNL